MSISSTTTRFESVGDGVTTVFTFPVNFETNSDIEVIERNNTTKVETTKTIGTHYTVTGAGTAAGGSVTMLVAPATGTTLIQRRKVVKTQPLSMVKGQQVPVKDIETRFDTVVEMIQELTERVDRALRLTDGQTATFDPRLPVSLVADKCIALNSTATGLVMGPSSADVASAGTNATAAAASATAASSSSSAATASASAAATSAAVAASNLFQAVVAKTASYTAVQADSGKIHTLDSTSGALVVTLPLISGLTLPYSLALVRINAAGNAVNVTPNGANTIQAGATKTLTSRWQGILLTCTGTTWVAMDFDQSATPNVLADAVTNLTAATAFVFTGTGSVALNAGGTNNDATLAAVGTGNVNLNAGATGRVIANKALNLASVAGNPANLRDLHYDSTAKAPAMNTDAAPGTKLVGCVSQSTADSSPISLTGDQTYSTAYTPAVAGALNVIGRRIRIHANGVHTTGATAGTIQLKVFINGASVIAAYGNSYTVSTTNFGWSLDCVLVVRTIGSGATLHREIRVFTDFDLALVREGADFFAPSTLSAGVDLTGTPVIAVVCNWGASGNSSTMKSMAVFIEN